MNKRYSQQVAVFETTVHPFHVYVAVSYQGWEGFIVSAKIVEINQGMMLAAVFGKYSVRPILNCNRGGQKLLEKATKIAREQIEKQNGVAWDVVVEVCSCTDFQLKEDEVPA
jgi:hypothetical protein